MTVIRLNVVGDRGNMVLMNAWRLPPLGYISYSVIPNPASAGEGLLFPHWKNKATISALYFTL